MYNPKLGSVKLNPRKYQVQHVHSVIREVVKHRTVVAQLATGGGKTVEFAMITSRYINKTDKSVLILVHRKELLNQCKATLANMFGITAELITAGTKYIDERRVYIGMVESVNRRVDYLNEVGLVIIDECHTAIFNKMHLIFKEELIIGFTATPKSVSKKIPLKTFYKKIVVCKEGIPELVAHGYLSRNVTRCPEDVVKTERLRLIMGEYDMAQMSMEYRQSKYVMNTVTSYARYAKGKKTMVFNVNIEHSKDVTDCFDFCGYNCRHVDGETPEIEREAIFKWFKETPDAILCNVGITTMGFDEPTVECVIVNRATTSMPLWLQMCGRGSRIIDADFIEVKQKEYPYELKEKNTFTIIDMGGNHVPHGDWCDERDWEDIFYNPETHKGGSGIAPVKTCPICRGLSHAAKAICEHLLPDGEKCLHIFNKRAAKEEEELGDLIIVSKNIDIEAYEEEMRKRGKGPYFAFYQMGRDIVANMHSVNRTLASEEVNKVFNVYFERCKEWFYKKFPNKKFDEQHHKSMASAHFEACFRQKFQRVS